LRDVDVVSARSILVEQQLAADLSLGTDAHVDEVAVVDVGGERGGVPTP
jgi:hypothetical protein